MSGSLGELHVLVNGIQFSVTDATKQYPDMPPTLRPLAEKVIARL